MLRNKKKKKKKKIKKKKKKKKEKTFIKNILSLSYLNHKFFLLLQYHIIYFLI